MKFTKIDLSKFPFIRPYGDYQTYTDFEKWHRFILDMNFIVIVMVYQSIQN